MTQNNFFKFKKSLYSGRSGGVKLYFNIGEFKQKPIKYFANVGYIPKYSKLQEFIKDIRKRCGVTPANNIEHLAYYEGGRILFPYHVYWMQSSGTFEFTLFDMFGQKPLYQISRKFNSFNERLTDEETQKISKAMELHYHLISSGYEFFRDNGDCKTYSDVSQFSKKLSAEIKK